MTGRGSTCACSRRESLREPDAGNLHVRFDEGRGAHQSLPLLLYRHPTVATSRLHLQIPVSDT